MASMAVMRQAAKALGVPAATIREASTSAELEQVIAQHMTGAKPASKAPAKKATGRPVGRPAKKAPRKAAASTSAPAKSRGAQAKRPTTAKPGRPPGRPAGSKSHASGSGRNALGSIDFNETDGWNAREGSAPDRIIAALRRYKGNREKAFDLLAEDLWDFTGKVKRDGTKRTKAEAESMLRYRIARTAWDFAMQTGQHEKSQAFGAKGNGSAPKPKATATVKRAVKAAPKATAPVKRGPGRPPGSKNRPKVTARAKPRLGRPGRPVVAKAKKKTRA